MSELTREQIVEAAKAAAAQIGSSPSRTDFERLTGISQYHIYRLFPAGGWGEVQRLAGLHRHPKDNQLLNDEDLLAEFHRVAVDLGKIPTWVMFSSKARISADVIRRRFGGLQGTLRKYHSWLELHDPESSLLAELRASSAHEIPAPPSLGESHGPQLSPQWSKTSGPEFGRPISFRGLRHAPINEQGVVFLFGMVSYELGFIVEAIHNAYPDCEAKRCVDRARDRWQRVRIEFEFKSRDFCDHGHVPDLCDVIVCWQHNWPECPLEVVELRRVIGELGG